MAFCGQKSISYRKNMAKFDCVFRTSYFYVIDEQKYEEFKKT